MENLEFKITLLNNNDVLATGSNWMDFIDPMMDEIESHELPLQYIIDTEDTFEVVMIRCEQWTNEDHYTFFVDINQNYRFRIDVTEAD